ncbi:hypothetical protein [Psychroserpens luteolus]|uniref:hypothetical protein n=1 Tax=Psychroserpens luteolus TaxID=2855840 RepID=UPI001E586356|nr:hypothetical protein [Psychroserpens luteolus]MCD2259112.1 hypothetical protein [Psychroserpens luteolus]
MKKLGPIILGIVIGAIAMYFYFHNIKNVDGMSDTPTPKGMISPEEIKILTEAYNPRYYSINDSVFRGIEGGDNRSSWYSLEDLRNFLTLAEKEAGELGYTMDGIRIYPGARPALADRPGYSTFLFVPTGYLNKSEGNMINLKQEGGNGDIPGGSGLDHGGNGIPPSANYPQ